MTGREYGTPSSSRWFIEHVWSPRDWEFGFRFGFGRFNIFGIRKRLIHVAFGPVLVMVGRETRR